MKLKVSATNLIYFFACFAMILEMNFFYLLNLPNVISKLSTQYTKTLLGFFSCFIVILMAVLRCRIRYIRYLRMYNYFIFCFALIMIIITMILYPSQKIGTTIRLCSNWLACWLTFPLVYLLQKGKEKSLLKFMNIISFIWYIILIVQFTIYQNSGIMILKNYDVVTRDGVIRLSTSSIGELMIIYNFYKLTRDEKKLKHKYIYIVQLVLGLYSLIVLQASRGCIVIMFVTLAVIYLVNSKNCYKVYIRVAVLTGALIYLINSNVFWRFIASFSVSGQYRLSTLNRMSAIKYYWSCFIKSPLWGIAYPGDDEANGTILHGLSGTSYVSDVGIIGLMGQTGIWILIIYFIFLVRMIYVLKRNLEKKGTLDTMGAGLLVYSVISIVTQNLFIPGMIMKAVLIISYFEYLKFQVNSIEQTEIRQINAG